MYARGALHCQSSRCGCILHVKRGVKVKTLEGHNFGMGTAIELWFGMDVEMLGYELVYLCVCLSVHGMGH